MVKPLKSEGPVVSFRLTPDARDILLVIGYLLWAQRGKSSPEGPNRNEAVRYAIGTFASIVPPKETWPWKCILAGCFSPVEWCPRHSQYGAANMRLVGERSADAAYRFGENACSTNAHYFDVGAQFCRCALTQRVLKHISF